MDSQQVDLRVQAWAYENHLWSMTNDAVAASLHKAEGLYQLELTVDAPRLIALQIGGATIPSRFVMLPPQGLSRVLLAPASCEETSVVGSLEIYVSLANSVADHLARFLTVASPSGREGLDEKLTRIESMDLLAGKRSDPLGAAVGGYFLVQDRSRMPVDWLRRLSDMVPWLADGPILCASAMLAQGGRSAVQDALRYLRDAALRGYPVFRRGIELYLDACRTLESSHIALDPDIASGAQRLSQVRAADTRQTAFTTFFGIHPNEPQAIRVLSGPASVSAPQPAAIVAPVDASAAAPAPVATDASPNLFPGAGSRAL